MIEAVSSDRADRRRPHFHADRAHEEAWKIDSKFELNSDLSRALGVIELNQLIIDAGTEQRKTELINLILTEISAVFSAGVKAESIALAAEWLLDSYGGRDPRLNYVQSMVVLEVLLGDKATSDIVGLGQLLRNRCRRRRNDTHGNGFHGRKRIQPFDRLLRRVSYTKPAVNSTVQK